MARARNQPRGSLALLVVAIVALLAMLVVRADAGPRTRPIDEANEAKDEAKDETTDEARRDDRDDRDDAEWEVAKRAPGAGSRSRLYVPITNAMVERVATFAPPVDRVVSAAYRAAGLGDDPTTGWRHRSRWSALIPSISVRTGQHNAWRDVSDPTVSHSLAFDARASWQLEQLMFDPNELRIATLDVARRRERRRVAALAIHLYFDWIAAKAAADHDLRALLHAQEKAAELDAVTAGWFSETLAKQAELR